MISNCKVKTKITLPVCYTVGKIEYAGSLEMNLEGEMLLCLET